MGLFRFVRSLREGLKSSSWSETPRQPKLHRNEVKIQTVPAEPPPAAERPQASVPPARPVEQPSARESQPVLQVDAEEVPPEGGLIAEDLTGLDETLGDSYPEPVEPEPDHEAEPEFAFQQMDMDEGAAQMARQFYRKRATGATPSEGE